MSADGVSDDDKSPLERAIDFAVFAPLGFALEFRRLVPELAEAGRRQVAFSRSLGKAALSSVAKAAERRTNTSHAASAPSPPSPSPRAESPAASAAVAGYDDMTAREIIDLARDAAEASVAWMRDQEMAGKRRKTVLSALERAIT